MIIVAEFCFGDVRKIVVHEQKKNDEKKSSVWLFSPTHHISTDPK
jgi:hypothetical protein